MPCFATLPYIRSIPKTALAFLFSSVSEKNTQKTLVFHTLKSVKMTISAFIFKKRGLLTELASNLNIRLI